MSARPVHGAGSRLGRLLVLLPVVAGLLVGTAPARAQSLDEQLDDDAFIRGLIDRDLPEVLEHYVESRSASDPVRAARHRVVVEQLRLGRLAAQSRERLAAVERVLAARSALIDGQSDDPRRALWLADQAADLLFEVFPVDAAGVTTLFGIPSPAQRERAQRVAREMNGLMAQAELEIERLMLEIESRPGYQQDEALQMRRRRLSAEERDRRIPFLRGVAAVLQAEINEPNANRRRDLYGIGVDLLAPLADALPGVLSARGRLYCGLALARLGRSDEAEAFFAAVADDAASHPLDVFAARMGTVVNQRTRRGLPAAMSALDGVEAIYDANAIFYRVLIADQRFRLRAELARGRERAATRRDELRSAFDAYLDLLESSPEGTRNVVREIVYRKLAMVAEDDVPLDELPAIVGVARADRLAREPARRAEAIALFEAALVRRDIGPRERASALFGLGRALYEVGRSLEAVERFTELARDLAGDAQAPRAIGLAAAIGFELRREHPRDDEVRAAFGDALGLLLEKYADLPAADRWRYIAGKLALVDGEYEDARRRFEAVPSDATDWLDAQFMIVNTLRAGTAGETAPADRVRGARRVVDAAERAMPTIASAVAAETGERREDLQYYGVRLRVFRAEALLALDEPRKALDAVADIENAPGLDTGGLGAALRVRIGAYQALGEPEKARGEIEHFLRAAPDEAGEVLGAMLAATLAEVESLRDEGQGEEATAKATREGVPLAVIVERWLDTNRVERDRSSALTARVATMYRQAGRYEDGLRLYGRLARDHESTVEVLFGRAECLFGLGPDRHAEAIGLYKRIAAGGPAVGHAIYWQSQVRMLDILDRAQRNTDKIVPRINRLRMTDPELGGERYRRQFQRLESRNR